jgi:hypothetical protein
MNDRSVGGSGLSGFGDNSRKPDIRVWPRAETIAAINLSFQTVSDTKAACSISASSNFVSLEVS